jgi:hypothetical protein
MSDHPPPDPDGAPARPGLADTIRAKMEEYEVDRHLNELAGTLEHAVRQGMARAGELAHEHRGDIERLIDKAASAVDRRTEGRHADRIDQVRGTLERGVEKIAHQRHDAGGEPDAGPGAGPDAGPDAGPGPGAPGEG